MKSIEAAYKTSSGQLIRINANSMNRFFVDKQKKVDRYINSVDLKKWIFAGQINGEIFLASEIIPQKSLTRYKNQLSGRWKDVDQAFGI